LCSEIPTAKTTGVLVERLEFKDGGTRKSKSFLRNGTENSSLCIAQAKLLIDEPFLVLIP
jgi:hypothetical protein